MSQEKPSAIEICPVHQEPLLEAANPVGPGRVRYCPVEGCQMATLVRGRVAQIKLPGMEPGVQHNLLPWVEKQTEAEVDAYCAHQGILSLNTTVRYKMQTCPHCGGRFRPQGGTGTDKAIPDRLLIPDWMPEGTAILLELKGSNTALSPEQRELARQKKILVARSGEEAAAIIQAVRERLEGLGE